MLFSFLASADLNPLVLVPGLYGSSLYGWMENYKTHWYCPKSMDKDMIWVDLKLAIPPRYNCLFEMMTVHYDKATQSMIPPPGLKIDITDFGGDQGVEYVDSSIFNLHFIESFHSVLEFLQKEKGYVMRKNLFGVPYDWRIAMAGLDKSDLFDKLKTLIEQAYELNAGAKVTVLGYSCGGYVIQHLLGQKADPVWKEKYIASAIFLAPAFGGSMDTLDVAWHRYFPIAKFLSGETVENCVMSMPCIHALFPNINVFGDTPIFTGPNGEITTAAGVPDFLVQQKKITGEFIDVMNLNKPFWTQKLADPGVPVYMLYNSKVQTLHGYHFPKGYEEDPELINGAGDGTVPAEGPEWACKNWDAKKALVCHDFAQENADDWDHGALAKNDYVIQKIYEATNNMWVKQVGVLFIREAHLEKNELGHFEPKPEIRKPYVGNKKPTD